MKDVAKNKPEIAFLAVIVMSSDGTAVTRSKAPDADRSASMIGSMYLFVDVNV